MADQQTRITPRHAYRPLTSYKGAVLKYAGFQSTQEDYELWDAYWNAGRQGNDHLFGDSYDAGVVWLDDYIADRITADTHKPVSGV
jgi:hypothetical protein